MFITPHDRRFVKIFKLTYGICYMYSLYLEELIGNGTSVVKTLQCNAYQVKYNKWIVKVFKSVVAHVLVVFFNKKLIYKGLRTVRAF